VTPAQAQGETMALPFLSSHSFPLHYYRRTPVPRLSLIVALASNGVIGRGGKLPWRLSADLKRFKALTMGHHILMGRRTFDSIGTLLSGRITIVLKRLASPYDYAFPGKKLYTGDRQALTADPAGTLPLAFARNLDEALALAADDDEVFVVGGAEIYALALPRADRLYVTWVEADVEGDTLFPEFDLGRWRLAVEEAHPADARNEFPYRFAVYDRIAGEKEPSS
jgi:dihydrofolate reductase